MVSEDYRGGIQLSIADQGLSWRLHSYIEAEADGGHLTLLRILVRRPRLMYFGRHYSMMAQVLNLNIGDFFLSHLRHDEGIVPTSLFQFSK